MHSDNNKRAKAHGMLEPEQGSLRSVASHRGEAVGIQGTWRRKHPESRAYASQEFDQPDVAGRNAQWLFWSAGQTLD